MTWKLYDYVNNRGDNEIKAWMESLQKPQRAKLNQKLVMLVQVGSELPPKLLSKARLGYIYRLKIKGNVELRLMLCEGPIDNDNEFTLLFGAEKRGEKLIPEDAEQRAKERRQEIIANPSSRRCLHEWVA